MEEPVQNLVTNIENRSQPHDFDLNKIPNEESFTDFLPDLPIANRPNYVDIQHIGTINHPENQEKTEYIIESEVALVDEMLDHVLPVRDGDVAYDISRCKP